MNDEFAPPVWVNCPQEGLRLRIAIEPPLASLIADGTQASTIHRLQKYGNSPATGDYIEGIAAITAPSGLVIGVHRRVYIYWRSPALEPVINFSAYYVSLLGLPTDMGEAAQLLRSPVTLLQTQQVGKAVDELDFWSN